MFFKSSVVQQGQENTIKDFPNTIGAMRESEYGVRTRDNKIFNYGCIPFQKRRHMKR
jgi:hypothetical protein